MIIVTGFEPFGGETRNPSWDAVRMLPEEVAGRRLIKLRLPVVYGRCFDPLAAALEDAPDCRAVLCVGQAGGHAPITPECIAINRLSIAPPEGTDGQTTYAPVIPDGPAAYFSTLPVEAMVTRMLGADIPAGLSHHAGTYVCNNLLYLLMHALHTQGLPISGGFVHVPFSSRQACQKASPPASMSLDMIAHGLLLCLEEIVSAM